MSVMNGQYVVLEQYTEDKNMENLKITGGARIGMMNATWPFATLKVSKDKLELNASIAGNLVFRPKDIVSIKSYSIIPIFGRGIKINHRIENYNSNVIFWTWKDPSIIIDQIRRTGFLDATYSGSSEEVHHIIQQQQSGSFPMKKSVAIVGGVLWNVLFLYDFVTFFALGRKGMPLDKGATIALAMLFVVSALTLASSGFRRLVLKDGSTIDDIKKFLYLIMFISGFIFIKIVTFKTVR